MRPNVFILVLLAATSAMVVGQSPHPQPHAPVPSVATNPCDVAPESVRSLARNTLTLADFEGMALQNNPTLAVAAARMDAACGREVQAGLYPNPVVGYQGEEMGLQGTAGQQGGFIRQRLIVAGKRRLDQAIAGMETDEAHAGFHSQQQRVLSDVRIRFNDACVAQRRVDLTQELARIGDELVAATGKLIRGRQGTENDLLQAEIRADEARILLDNAKNRHLEAWRRLTTVAGVPALPVTPLFEECDVELPSWDWESCCATVLDGNPTLQAARTRVDRAAISLQRARREPIPNIDLSVSYRRADITRENMTDIEIGIPIPLFDRNQGNVRTAQAEFVAACNDVTRIELDLKDRAATAYRRYANARQQVERYRTSMVPRAERSLKLVTGGYEKGQVNYLTLLTSQQTFLRVNLSHLDALREYRTAACIIEGQLLTDSLAVDTRMER